MKIYTKKGDLGETMLYGGTMVSKDDLQIEAYGTIDELSAFLGHLNDKLKSSSIDSGFIHEILSELFVIGAHLANDRTKKSIKLPEFSTGNITKIEHEIDRLETDLVPMTHFILPSGHELISFTHLVRTVCRRSERKVVTLHKVIGGLEEIVKYLNRLSDYFFTLARHLAFQLKVEEIKWMP